MSNVHVGRRSHTLDLKPYFGQSDIYHCDSDFYHCDCDFATRSDSLPPSSYLYRPERPPPAEQAEAYQRPKYRTFPEEVDRIPLVKADCSIPLLTDVPDPEVFQPFVSLRR